MFNKRLIFTILAIAVTTSVTSVEAARVDNVNILSVRAYNDGNAHIDISQQTNAACGARLRVPNQPGRDNVMRLATAALLSGNRVVVESEDAKSANFCNLVFIWLQAK